MTEYEDDPIEEEELEDGELPAGEPDTAGEKIARSAPWWLISIGFHTLIILIMLFIVAFLPIDLIPEAFIMNTIGKPNFELQSNIVNPESSASKISENEKEIEKTEKTETKEDKPTEFEKKEVSKIEDMKFTPTNSKSSFKETVKSGGAKSLGLLNNRMGPMKSNSLKHGGGNTTTEKTVSSALNWLARHQNPDGSWSIEGCTKNCGKHGKTGNCDPAGGDSEYDVGATGLALLCFLGEGYYPGGRYDPSKDPFNREKINYDEVCKIGLKFLMKCEEPMGGKSDHFMYNHVLAALALVEGYDLTKNSRIRDYAQKAVDFTLKAQNVEGEGLGETGGSKLAWRYTVRPGDNDSSITGWCAMLLKSADNAGLSFSKSAFEGIKKWFESVTDEETGIVGYDRKWNSRYPLGAVIRGLNGKDKFEIQPAVTAIAIMSKLFINKGDKDDKMKKAVQKIMKEHLPRWKDNDGRVAGDFYYWYNASYALFQFFPTSGDEWRTWNEAIQKVLIKEGKQHGDDKLCNFGSYEPEDRWACKGGRVASTALACLTLQVYYRYAQLKEKWER